MRWRQQKRGRRKVWLTALFVVGLYLGVCFVLARSYLHPTLEPLGRRPDGFTLAKGGFPTGTWTGGPSDAKRTYLLIHGYGARQSFWNPLASDLAAKGFRVVVPPLPGHGLEGSPQTGFGFRESEVVVQCARALREESKARIIVVGCSMGGAASWLAVGKAPDAFDAIATESAFARFDEAMMHWFERRAPGASFYLRPVITFATWMSGLNPGDIVPMDAARIWRGKPALVIQAGSDQLILRSHADRLAEAAESEMWVVPKARHARVQDVALPELVDRLSEL